MSDLQSISLARAFRAQLDLLRGQEPRKTSIRIASLLMVMATFSLFDGFPGLLDTEAGGASWAWVRSETMGIPEGMISLLLALVWLHLTALIWSIRSWRANAPSERGYHWAMPIDRRAHDLLRVAAGAVWLELLIFAFVGTGATIGLLAGRGSGLASISVAGWASFFAGPLIFYLPGSAVSCVSERPGRWIFGMLFGSLALLQLSILADVLLFAPTVFAVVSGPWGFSTAAGGSLVKELVGQGTTTLAPAILWLTIGLAALGLAVTRRPRT